MLLRGSVLARWPRRMSAQLPERSGTPTPAVASLVVARAPVVGQLGRCRCCGSSAANVHSLQPTASAPGVRRLAPG
eukprot:15457676-Alexandrium_andersonii.AAC.1